VRRFTLKALNIAGWPRSISVDLLWNKRTPLGEAGSWLRQPSIDAVIVENCYQKISQLFKKSEAVHKVRHHDSRPCPSRWNKRTPLGEAGSWLRQHLEGQGRESCR
jgi:hypothetical protein